MKKNLIVLSCLVPSLAFSYLAIANSKENVVKADGPELVYKLDFADEANRGKNVSGTETEAATIVDNGGVSYKEAPHDGTGLFLSGGASRSNYFSIPAGEFFDGQDSISISGWFYIDYSCVDWARMVEVSKHTPADANDIDVDRIAIMPKSFAQTYGGMKIDILENVETKGGGGWHEFADLFHGTSSTLPGNTPADDGILTPFNAWTHYTYEFGSFGLKVYQNGKLACEQSSIDLTADSFYANDARIVFGATYRDGTWDFTGGFSDIRVYKGALSSEEIISEYGINYKDLKTHEWNFEDGCTDSVLNVANARLEHEAEIVADGDTKSNVLSLNGATTGEWDDGTCVKSSLRVGTEHVMSGYHELTVAMDVNVSSSTPSYSRLMETGSWSEQTLIAAAKWGDTDKFHLKWTDGVTASEIEWDMSYDVWHNLVITLDGKAVAIYVDGALVASSDSFKYNDTVLWDVNDRLAFGRALYWNDGSLIGKMDNIKMYQSSVTAAEALEIAGAYQPASIKVNNTKTSYNLMDDLDLSAISLSVVLANGMEREITDVVNEMFDYDFYEVGDREVTVSYAGLQTTFTVNIPDVITGIVYDGPTKTEYYVGEELDLAGLEVKASYYSGETADLELNTDYTVTGFDSTQAGPITLTITYGEYTETFDVVIKEKEKDPQTSEESSPVTSEESSVEKKDSSTAASSETKDSTSEKAEEPTEKKGCGGAAIPSMFGLLALAGALISKKRK